MRHSSASRGVYITRPERTIWPVIALVATMLFSAAGEAGVSLVRGAVAERGAAVRDVPASRGTPELGRERHAPAGAIKSAVNSGHFARNSQPKHRVIPDARAPLRRAAGVVLARSREVADRRLVDRSFRQTVVSPRSGGLIRYFPTAPPQGEVTPGRTSLDRNTGA